MELQHIDFIDCFNFACANLPFKCSFCGEDYKEHKDFDNFFQGMFDGNGKIACCKKCFEIQSKP